MKVTTPAQPTESAAVLRSLADPTRLAVYELAARRRGPVGRDLVAEELGISRQTAAYHLDKLAEEGLLEVEFKRLSGRSGPGAGRPSKLYRRSDREYQVSVPARSYLLAARVLLRAVRAGAISREAVLDSARRLGVELGAEGLDAALAATGYEPAREAEQLRFRNCPFHALLDEDRATTCALNLALVEGMVEGAGDARRPCLQPEEGYCCVRLLDPG